MREEPGTSSEEKEMTADYQPPPEGVVCLYPPPKNGTRNTLELVRTIAQFLVIPILWMLYQIWIQLGVVNERVVRLEVELRNDRAQTEYIQKNVERLNALESQIMINTRLITQMQTDCDRTGR